MQIDDDTLLMCIRQAIPKGCIILKNTCNICKSKLILSNLTNITANIQIRCDNCHEFITDMDCIGCMHCGVDVCLSCINLSNQ